MWEEIAAYFQMNSGRYFAMLGDHIYISLCSLAAAAVIGIPAGVICVRNSRIKKVITAVFGTLRIVPSLAILLLMLPVLGTGMLPAMTALVLLAVPAILLNTISGLESVPESILEAAQAMGMEDRQIWLKIKFPLALPFILTGVKTAAVEIIASAALAAKIGAGGLGDIIFAGIGLLRTEFLLIGGISVAALSVLTGILFGLLEKMILRYKDA